MKFGTDGVRGKVGQSPITPDFVLRLGYAAGRVLASRSRHGERASVLIGKDTRLSGYMIETALVAGFTSVGMDVLLTGPMPTPAVGMLTRSMRADLGVIQGECVRAGTIIRNLTRFTRQQSAGPTTFALSLASPQFLALAWTPKMNSSSLRFSSAFTT